MARARRVPSSDPGVHPRRRGDHRLAASTEYRADHARRGAAGALLTAASPQVGVLQAGSWGTTLATILTRDAGRRVVLWTRDPAQAEEISTLRENRRYLPGIRIPDGIEVTAELDRALAAPDLIVAVPAGGVRAFRDRVAPLLRPHHRILSATKGLADDGTRMSQLWSEAAGPERVAVLSGPNISREIAAGLPAPTVVASTDAETARHFQQLVGTRMFRAYTNDDVVGVELCGALKNIVAMGAGAIDGMGYGDNAKAGFMTRGLAEIVRFAFTHGANPLTAAGIAGFGDLIATCMSAHSRNRLVGELLAKGLTLAQVRERLGGQVAEGIGTTEATHTAAGRLGVTMPITEQTFRVLFEGKPIRQAMRDLMDRERGDELAGPLGEVARLVAQLAAARESVSRPS